MTTTHTRTVSDFVTDLVMVLEVEGIGMTLKVMKTGRREHCWHSILITQEHEGSKRLRTSFNGFEPISTDVNRFEIYTQNHTKNKAKFGGG